MNDISSWRFSGYWSEFSDIYLLKMGFSSNGNTTSNSDYI
uniref:Uncharacterized protein n=1 Tax=Lepeophtheirus salmonis TaxID=72036 RepID=A0A0K2UEY5_LEPSM